MKSPKYKALVLFPQIGVCGLECKHCWVDHNLKKHKPFEEVKSMIDNMAGVLDEPAITEHALLYFLDELTLYPQVTELLAYCRERKVVPQPTLVTNGSGIATRDNWEAILEGLKNCGVNGLLLAIYGDEEYHDWFSGSKGSFQRTLEATRRAEDYGLWVVWNMYMTKENVEGIAKVTSMKRDSKMRISVPNETEKWLGCSDIHADISVFESLPEDCLKYVRTEFKSEAEWIELILSGEMDSEEDSGSSECSHRSLFVYDDIVSLETIYPSLKIGHIGKVSLREIFEGDPVPPDHFRLADIDTAEYAKKYGKPDSTKACSLIGLKLNLLGRSLE